MSNRKGAEHTQEHLAERFRQSLTSGVGRSRKHESADKHVSGEAQYIDDRLEFPNQLHLAARLSERAHAQIEKLDLSACYDFPGVVRVITWQDVPGELDIAPLTHGDPLMAKDKVEYVGQVIAVVAAEDPEIAWRAAQAIKVTYRDLPARLDVIQSLREGFLVQEAHRHQRGDADRALAQAKHRIQGELHVGGQEHFYLETQIASVMPAEDGGMLVYSSTQNPTEIQKLVASVLNLPMHRVTIDTRRMGGGFGGKETQAAGPACLCAVMAHLTGRPVKMRLNRRDDMLITGKRHPFYIQYDVGFDDSGLLHGVKISLAGNCGYSLDLSGSIVDRAMFHSLTTPITWRMR
jgi:xanthine dehydrogenase large subunit